MRRRSALAYDRAAHSKRGSRARTNFVYSDMLSGSSVTSIISPDEAKQNLSSLFFTPTQPDHPTPQQPLSNPDTRDECHYSCGFPAMLDIGDHFWTSYSVDHQEPVIENKTRTVPHSYSNQVYDDRYNHHTDELPHFPSDISECLGSNMSVSANSGEEMGQGVWSDSTSLMGFEPVESGSYMRMGFDSCEYLHSPLFSRILPVSDKVPKGFDLESSSYFF